MAEASTKGKHCECCQKGAAKFRRTKHDGKYYTANVCDPCATANHSLGSCMMCKQPVWRCAQLSHVSLMHPGLMEKMVNRDRVEGPLKIPKPGIERIGRIGFNLEGQMVGETEEQIQEREAH